jgi:hypothetical protein
LDGDNEVVSIFDSKGHSKNIRMTLWDWKLHKLCIALSSP